MNCSNCRGTVRVDLGHGLGCNACGATLCGNCFSAINVPHMAAGHAVGIVVCPTCRTEGEKSGHIARMQASHRHYASRVHVGMDEWRTQMRKPVEQRATTEEIFGDARAREENVGP